jgi:hypothetical protein
MGRVYENMWIDKTYRPTRATETLKEETPAWPKINNYSSLSNQWVGNVNTFVDNLYKGF